MAKICKLKDDWFLEHKFLNFINYQYVIKNKKINLLINKTSNIFVKKLFIPKLWSSSLVKLEDTEDIISQFLDKQLHCIDIIY